MNRNKKVYYSVHKGRVPGVYTKWEDCKNQIEKFEGAEFKKFENEEEANNFMQNGFGKKGFQGTKNQKIHNAIVAKNENRMKEMEESDKEKIYIYTDGSLIRQGKVVGCGYGYYIPVINLRVSKPLVDSKITNNRAELRAILEGVESLPDEHKLNKKICIFTDSQYCIYLFTGTGERYKKNGFKNNGEEVPNVDLIEELLTLKSNYDVVLLKVEAHTNNQDVHSLGNKTADQLANDAAQDNIKSKGGKTKESDFEKKVYKPYVDMKKSRSIFTNVETINQNEYESMTPSLNSIKKNSIDVGYSDIFENYDKEIKEERKKKSFGIVDEDNNKFVSAALIANNTTKNKKLILKNTSLTKWFEEE